MSIRKGKSQLSVITEGTFDDGFNNDDDNKSRFVWSSSSQKLRIILLTLLFLGIAAFSLQTIFPTSMTTRSTSSTSFSSVHLRQELTESQQRCTVWIAPSSLKGVNGYGIFTVRDLAPGERVLPSHDGLGVPVESFRHVREPHAKERADWIRVWDNYWWARGVPDHVAYEAPTDIVDYQIGFGALPNHHCLLQSLDIMYPEIAYEDSLVDRYQDPGTGAFSYNMGREFTVHKALKAGDEIFLNYGYCNRDRKMPDWTKFIYMPEDFEAAATVVGAYQRKQESPIRYDALGRLEVLDANKVNGFVKELLPQTERELDALVNGVVHKKSLIERIAQNSLNKRTPEWIKRNGMCMENIIPKTSTIPHAGQGAFANFHISAGEIIAPAPLMQILDKGALNMYSPDGRRNGTQLLMNYCFNHKDSTVLLCPNTNAVLINHCSTRTKGCGPKGPNAMYQWSTGWDPTSDDWRKMTLEQLLEQNGRGLAFEIVATRDIAESEEIFIDYGPEWEKAWGEHVSSWKPPPRDHAFITAKAANENKGPIIDSLVSGDLRKTVDHHPHLLTACVYGATQSDDHQVYHEDMDWKALSDADIMKRFASDGSNFGYSQSRGPGDYRKHTDKMHWPCTLIGQMEEKGKYIVRVHQSYYPRSNGEMPWHRHKLPRILYSYPRESIHYFKQPFTSDQHLPGVFRQPIGIRDELFPQQWKNLAQ